MNKQPAGFIPALKFKWLSPFFDVFLAALFPEKPFKMELIRKMEILSGEKILDFGSGTGTLLVMAKTAHPDAEIQGVDIDPDIIKIARKKIADRKLDIKITRYDGKRLPFGDNSIDKVMSSLVFHHISTDRKPLILKEIFRVLKPGGKIIIADFGRPSGFWSVFASNFLMLLEPIGDNIRGRIPGFMEQAGFRNVEEKGRIKTAFGVLTYYFGKKAEIY